MAHGSCLALPGHVLCRIERRRAGARLLAHLANLIASSASIAHAHVPGPLTVPSRVDVRARSLVSLEPLRPTAVS